MPVFINLPNDVIGNDGEKIILDQPESDTLDDLDTENTDERTR